MAGTRLLIQGTFLVQFLLVIGVAVYRGILQNPSDRLSIAVFQQTGRGLLSNLIKACPILKNTNENVILTDGLPPVKLLCQESQLVFWKDIVQTVKLPSDQVLVQAGAITKICETSDLTTLDDNSQRLLDEADMILCDFWIPRERARLVVAGSGALLFYSRSVGKRKVDMMAIYPKKGTNSDTTGVNCLDASARIKVTLAVDSNRENSDWKEWTSSLQSALEESKSHSFWRSLVRSRKNPIDFDIRVVDVGDVQSLIQNNQTVHHIHPSAIDSVYKVFGKASSSSKNHIEVVMYLPVHGSTYFGSGNVDAGSATLMATQGSRLVRILSSSAMESSVTAIRDMLAKDAIGDATDWITRQCMGIPTNNKTDEESLDGNHPRWYSKLWWHRSLSTRYAKAVHMAQRQATLWNEMSYRVPLTREIVKEFHENVLKSLEAIPTLLANQSLAEALASLEASIDLLEKWERDDTYMPPLDFPPEQYAAIFAPLVVPLLLPLLIGFVREFRRYHELNQKTIDADKKND
eukprot:scaffold1485_cov171-Amphora_coffeaeformis.AAC.15